MLIFTERLGPLFELTRLAPSGPHHFRHSDNMVKMRR
jgi:hypothetical protein